eukprot:TRINITY_DN776253_c0_g1_i1.p1 TRINITY_DN776253_c0_g1~~TRINITY_DN776253_c0_g1_i1.p1  ORF type:complete len:457 (-),score=82.84 TRINITY_DN776253_c0_g1_i1:259-1629(-)
MGSCISNPTGDFEGIGNESRLFRRKGKKMGKLRMSDESILLIFLKNSSLREFLVQFLKQQFCAELLEFWLIVEEYKSMASAETALVHQDTPRAITEQLGPRNSNDSNSNDENDERLLKDFANDIYLRFIKTDAEREINITMGVKQGIIDGLEEASKDLFLEAQDECFNLLLNDSFKRFMVSEAYKPLIPHIQNMQSGGRSSILTQILVHPPARMHYEEFCKQQMCDKNPDFWVAAEVYRRTVRRSDRVEQAKELFQKYIASSSERCIDISDEEERAYYETKINIADIDLFENLQHQILDLMAGDAFYKFEKSKFYQLCMQELSEDGTIFVPLHHILTKKSFRPHLHKFMKKNLCEENLLLYTDIQTYKTYTPPDQHATQAQLIYETYLVDGAPHWISLDDFCTRNLKDKLKNPNRDTFKDCETMVLNTMKTDTYNRFLSSVEYMEMVKANNIDTSV